MTTEIIPENEEALIILIVDVGFEQTSDTIGIAWSDVYIGYSGWDKARVALGQTDDAVTLSWHQRRTEKAVGIRAEALCRIDSDGAIALKTHIDDE